jgi:hypothetical protein
MPRTFTLRRLLINVTLAGVICALVRIFPAAAFGVAEYLGLFVPAILICMLGASCSARPWESLSVGLLGAVVLYLLAPATSVFRPTYSETFQSIAPWPAGGALIFTLVSVGFSHRTSLKAE